MEILWYTRHMKVFFMLLFWALVLWPILSWFTFHVSGWSRWQKLFRREVTNDTDIAAAVGLKKFGSYNRCVRVGIEDYGIAFKPTHWLPFHKSFCIPWIQVLSYTFTPRKLSSVCILRTPQGTIRIVGEVAEIVARGCGHHFVQQQL